MSIKFDRAQKKYSYFDKNGVEINAGDTIRRDGLGGVDKVYEWESEDGVRGLGTDATNPVWIKNGRAVPCEFGIYRLDEVDCATSEVIKPTIIQVAHLIEYLLGDASKENKAAEIKAARDNGLITRDEAIDLAVEYFTGK